MHKPVQFISTLSFSDWKHILIEVKKRIGENNVVIVSAGVAFFGFFGHFPCDYGAYFHLWVCDGPSSN